MKAYDLLVIGAGSGNMLLGPELNHLSTAIVEPDRFGGTCLNRGCIPSKMLVLAADAARAVADAERLGVHATSPSSPSEHHCRHRNLADHDTVLIGIACFDLIG